MSDFNPLVSIVIPVYNGSNYLREAIESALTQTYKNIEVLVINDGSNDDGATRNIALSYGDKIRYFEKENGGVASALNLGLEKMAGEYFSWLSHDDVYAELKIEKQINEVLLNNSPVIIYCNYYFIDSEGKIISEANLPENSQKNISCFLAFETKTGLHGCSLLIPKIAFHLAGNFNENLLITQDYDLWFRMSKYLKFKHVNEKLLFSRRHKDQDSQKKRNHVLREVQELHTKMLDSLYTGEIFDFEGSIDYYVESYTNYKNQGYEKIALKILNILIKSYIYKEDKYFKSFINNEIIGSIDTNEINVFTELLLKYSESEKNAPVIVFYMNNWQRGGLENVITTLADYLKNRYSIVLISAYENDFFSGYKLSPDIFHFRIKVGNNYYSRLFTLIYFLDTRVFVGNHNYFEDFLDFYKKISEYKIKTIAFNHSFYFHPLWQSWLYPIFKKRRECYEQIDAVIWTTSFGYNLYKNQFNNGVYIPNPLSHNINKLSIKTSCNNFRIICVGRFTDEIKRFDRILTVFDRVLKKNPNVELLVVGELNKNLKVPPENNETIGELVNRLGFSDEQIIYAGEQNELDTYYHKSDLLLMTSDNEGFGMVLLEAAAFGVPSIIFEVPGLEDIISDGINGFIVPQNDFDGMANKIDLFFNDPDLRKRMSDNAYKITCKFDIAEIGIKWDLLLNILLSNDESCKLHIHLLENFNSTIKDNQVFLKTLIVEYEKNIINIIENYNKNIRFVLDRNDLSSIRFNTLVKLILKKIYKKLIQQKIFSFLKPVISLLLEIFRSKNL